ncbi:MAG: hypothetical protein R3F55_07390 [Alphaproteobacteria bacterium]
MRRAHRAAHARLWVVLAVAIPLGLALALLLSGPVPTDPAIDSIRAAASGE